MHPDVHSFISEIFLAAAEMFFGFQFVQAVMGQVETVTVFIKHLAFVEQTELEIQYFGIYIQPAGRCIEIISAFPEYPEGVPCVKEILSHAVIGIIFLPGPVGTVPEIADTCVLQYGFL